MATEKIEGGESGKELKIKLYGKQAKKRS